MRDMDDPKMAFPYCSADELDEDKGMTLRDWFAGQALAGIACEYFSNDFNTGAAKADLSQIARCAYLVADRMMEEREKN